MTISFQQKFKTQTVSADYLSSTYEKAAAEILLKSKLVADPIKLDFFASKEFLRFFVAKLGHFVNFFSICCKTLNLNSENPKTKKKSFIRSATVIILNFIFTKILSDKFGSGKFILC